MEPITRFAPVVCSFVLVAACGDAGASAGWEGPVDTLPNGVVVIDNPEHGIWGDSAEWRRVQLEWPHRLDHFRVRGDALYGVVRDDLDVPYVVRLRIAGRGDA